MSKTSRILIFSLFVSLLVLTACTSSAGDPAKTIEAYWQAMAAQDGTQLSSLSCADYEAQALANLESFQSVELTLSDLKCTASAITGETADVTCTGSLSASYGAENFEFDLSTATYSVVKVDGSWLMCGEK